MIKFNVYDKLDEVYITWKDIMKSENLEKAIPQCILNEIRYIPLIIRTVNGVEVSEGDIIEVFYTPEVSMSYEVFIENGCFSVKASGGIFPLSDFPHRNIKVTGNIYNK